MVYIITSIIIYLILVLFFWSLCAIKNRSSLETDESMLKSAEAEASFDEVFTRIYSSVDGV
jgi:hypothetical protein